MNSTRIEVPVTLPTPHFDDERTIATARQVKPIGRTKVSESWRQVRTVLPLILLATFCGALGAAGVNYYEDRQTVQPTVRPAMTNSPAEPKVESSPIVVATSAAPTPTVADTRDAAAAEVKAEATPSPQSKTNIVTASSSDKPATVQEKKAADIDAAKLTRKRRVNSNDETEIPANKKGAGRIVDIFSGPNPPQD